MGMKIVLTVMNSVCKIVCNGDKSIEIISVSFLQMCF